MLIIVPKGDRSSFAFEVVPQIFTKDDPKQINMIVIALGREGRGRRATYLT